MYREHRWLRIFAPGGTMSYSVDTAGVVRIVESETMFVITKLQTTIKLYKASLVGWETENVEN